MALGSEYSTELQGSKPGVLRLGSPGSLQRVPASKQVQSAAVLVHTRPSAAGSRSYNQVRGEEGGRGRKAAVVFQVAPNAVTPPGQQSLYAPSRRGDAVSLNAGRPQGRNTDEEDASAGQGRGQMQSRNVKGLAGTQVGQASNQMASSPLLEPDISGQFQFQNETIQDSVKSAHSIKSTVLQRSAAHNDHNVSSTSPGRAPRLAGPTLEYEQLPRRADPSAQVATSAFSATRKPQYNKI